MGFFRQEYWSGLLCPLPGDLPSPGLNLCLLHWQVGSLPLTTWEAHEERFRGIQEKRWSPRTRSSEGRVSRFLAPNACSVAQWCLTLCDPMGCSLPGSSVHGISQARILEWMAISFSRGFPDPGIKHEFLALAGRLLTTEGPESPEFPVLCLF